MKFLIPLFVIFLIGCSERTYTAIHFDCSDRYVIADWNTVWERPPYYTYEINNKQYAIDMKDCVRQRVEQTSPIVPTMRMK